MRIAIAQIDPIVGAFEANLKKIEEAYKRACREQARLLLTPELSLFGYPPHDLIERPEIFERTERALEKAADLTKGRPCALIVGHVAKNPLPMGRMAQNVVSVLSDGKVLFQQAKTLLPTYDVFDEARIFEPAHEVKLWEWEGKKIAVAICEDLWGNDPAFGRKLYGHDPVEEYEKLGADLVISISASPFERSKRTRREALHGEIAKRLNAPLIYINQTGSTDEILFDGGSFATHPQEGFLGRLPVFETAFGVLDWKSGGEGKLAGLRWVVDQTDALELGGLDDTEVLLKGILTGIREYFFRTGFKKAVIGLSGGIDSAVVGALAAKALGPKNVLGVAMSSQYSSSHSLEDAQALAENLGIRFEIRPIKFAHSILKRELSEARGPLKSLADENLQARIRGLILMTYANHEDALVLATSNKSEAAMGYSTLYGDMVGALAPIGDLYKTQVYELAEFINKTHHDPSSACTPNPIPRRSIDKSPSAELRPDQKDEDTLPPYELLDQILADYLEKRTPVEELVIRYSEGLKVAGAVTLKETLRRIELSEYKRRQAAPVLKLSQKAFGIGRRMPIAKRWDQ
jgi:NAD+ synthase (glutamine-hydrolysing)